MDSLNFEMLPGVFLFFIEIVQRIGEYECEEKRDNILIGSFNN